MKLDTTVVLTKGLCFVAIGFFTPLTTGLAQWANSHEWPDRLVWVIMGATCAVGAASQLLSYLSGSYIMLPNASPQVILSSLPKHHEHTYIKYHNRLDQRAYPMAAPGCYRP